MERAHGIFIHREHLIPQSLKLSPSHPFLPFVAGEEFLNCLIQPRHFFFLAGDPRYRAAGRRACSSNVRHTSEGRVVCDDAIADKIMRALDLDVVDLLAADRLDRDDRIPGDVDGGWGSRR